jgi:ribosome maturation factor RimP
MGYSLVELNRQQIRGRLQVRVVIHHYRGIGLKDCELVHKTILPRIELMEKNREVNLEVSSPGITRNIKYAEEFAIFIDRRARILTKDSEDWIGGTILGADEKAVELSTPEGKLTISISDIKKAKLAYSQEDE